MFHCKKKKKNVGMDGNMLEGSTAANLSQTYTAPLLDWSQCRVKLIEEAKI